MPDLACPSCSHLLDADHNFCPSCGAATPTGVAEAVRPEEDSDEARSRARLQEAVGADFEVGRLLGRGGFAEVFEATDTRLQRNVAIKVTRPDLTISRDVVERFQREARSIAALRHPHVMEIYSVGERDGVAYFVMPLVEGESLGDLLKREGELPLDEARRILGEAARALHAAHQAGTIHRDVKPENILLDGEERRVLIADFGIAKALEGEEEGITGSGMFVGTPQYMSPEQATGDGVDHRSDVYSLGVVAFQMVAGRLPFQAHGLQALIAKHLTEEPPALWTLRSECPELLARVVERCLAKDPGERWESLEQMVAVLEGRAELPRPPVRMGVPGVEGGRGHPATGDAATLKEALDALDAPLKSFRRTAVGVAVGVVGLVAADAVLGLRGASAWLVVVAVAYLAARAGRLWSKGYEWRDLLHTPPPEEAGRITTGEHVLTTGGREGFGRHGSLVRECARERAVIVKAFAQISHAEQKRFPELQQTVEMLVGRIKHLARKVVTLEERIAETSERVDRKRREGPGPDAELASSSLSRQAARLQELNSARDEAASELRRCVGMLRDVREALTDRFGLDPARALDFLEEVLGRAQEHLAQRAG